MSIIDEARDEADKKWTDYPRAGFSGPFDRRAAFVDGVRWMLDRQPSDREVEAAAKAICQWDEQYRYDSLEDGSPAKSMYQLAARAALLAAREVARHD
jgi:hypothetical protein